jgi:alpha-1,3-rhamnosyl/mannosyltransferase
MRLEKMNGESTARIGFVIEGMSGSGSGVWTRFQSLVQGLANAGVFVHVLAGKSLQQELSGLPLASLTILPIQAKARRFFVKRRQLKKFVDRMKIDIVHIESPPFPRTDETITIGSIHDLRFLHEPWKHIRTAEGVYQKLFLKHQAKNLSSIATLGPWAASEVTLKLHIPISRVLQIPPIVTPQSMLSVLTDETLIGQFVLVLGHLEKRKNVSTIIRAAASNVWPKHIGILIAGGDAGEEATLRILAKEARCRVQFLGKINESTKWQLLRSADLVLVPSLFEGFGIVAVEAPLAGTPAIVSDQGALVDLAGDPRAIVPALDHLAWAQRVALLCSDIVARQQILEAQVDSAIRFQPETVIPELLQIYDQLLSSRDRA